MAAGSQYKLMLEAKIDPTLVQAQIQALSQKSQLLINVKFSEDAGGLSKIEAEINRIQTKLQGTIDKIVTKTDIGGNIGTSLISYTDKLGNPASSLVEVNTALKTTQTYVQNIKQTREQTAKTEENVAMTLAKQSDEMATITQRADKFLAGAQSKNASVPEVAAGISIAQQIKTLTAGKETYTADEVAQLRNLDNQLTLTNASLNTGRTAWDSWVFGLKNAIKQTIEYAISVGLLYGALQQLQSGIQFVKDLNKELVAIQVLQAEGAQTNSQIASLALSFNDLAKSMGATTIEVAQGSVEWLRQGKTVAETQELLKSTLMLAKLGNMDTATSTNLLTATMNGFNLSADQAVNVVSKLIAVDNIAATSAEELATALQYSSAVANNVGVSFDQLVAMIGTVSSVTRLSAETIGQAFKTMFTRMEQVKAGAIDETGMSLNNVEKALSGVNIKLRDSVDSFRPLGEVINEVAAKWGTFNEVQRDQVANAIAGVRQGQIFLTLMQHYADVQKYLTAEVTSAGLAQSRYQIYLNGVEAAQNKLTASWESLWMATVQSGGITWFLNLGAAILGAVAAGGGLIPVLTIALGLLVAIKATQLTIFFTTMATGIVNAIGPILNSLYLWSSGLDEVAASETLVGIAADNMIPIIGVAIAVAAAAFMVISAKSQEAANTIREVTSAITDLRNKISQLEAQKKTLNDLGTSFEELKNKVNPTIQEQKDFVDIQNQIKQLVPEVSGTYDDQGNFAIALGVNIRKLIDLKNEELRINQALLDQDLKKNFDAQTEAYKQQADALAKLVKDYQIQQQGLFGPSLRPDRNSFITPEMIANQKLLSEAAINDLKITFNSMTLVQQEAIRVTLRAEGDAGNQMIALLESTTGKILSQADRVYLEYHNITSTPTDLPTTMADSQAAFDKLLKDTIDLIKYQKQQEIQAIQDQLTALKDSIDKQKQYYKDLYDSRIQQLDNEQTQLQRNNEDQKANNTAEKQALQDQLSAYNDIIDAQERILDAQKAQRSYEETRGDKQKQEGKLEAEIAALSLDTSAEGIAKKLALEDQLAKLKAGMADDTYNHDIDLQKAALEAEKKAAADAEAIKIKQLEDEQAMADQEYQMKLREIQDSKDQLKADYDAKIKSLDDEYTAKETAFNSQIKQLQDYLSQSGTISNDAAKLLSQHNATLYQELIDWNKKYGTGISEDITNNWDIATLAVQAYMDKLGTLSDMISGLAVAVGTLPSQIGFHHSGVDSGFVGGGTTLKSNEEFAKLMKGELVINSSQMDNFMHNILPQIPSITNNSNVGGVSLDHVMEITVQGGLDEKVMPDLERLANDVANKIAQSMGNRGMVRSANSFSI